MQQNNWMKLLLLTQLIINNKISVTTKESLFKMNHRIDPNFNHLSKKTSKTTKQFNKIWKNLSTNWKKSKNFINRRNQKKKKFQLKKGNKIFLLIKNFKSK